MLMIIMVVRGIYIFRFGLLIMISPGRRPRGTFPSQGQSSPTARNVTPRIINVFCIMPWTPSIQQEIASYRPANSCSISLTMLPSARLPKCFMTGAIACIGLLNCVKSIFVSIHSLTSSLLTICGRYAWRVSR